MTPERMVAVFCPRIEAASDGMRTCESIFEVCESVLEVVETFVPVVEVLEPGICAFKAKGPSRYFGGERALVEKMARALQAIDEMNDAHPSLLPRVGIAHGHFAAVLAAQRSAIVDNTKEFLEPLPIESLGIAKLASMLKRLGVQTLGELAALPRDKVIARFGAQGSWAHAVASSKEDRLLRPRDIPPDLTVRYELDPPAQAVDQATFAAKAAADMLIDQLVAKGLCCMRLEIEIATEHGEIHSRSWRYSGPFTAVAIAERTRWQLEGWLSRATHSSRLALPKSGAVEVITLRPEEIVGDATGQLALWGRPGDVSDRVRRALDRVQGLVGHDGVVRAHLVGGRNPAERFVLVPWGDPFDEPLIRSPMRVETPTWPGKIPSPLPTVTSRDQVWVCDSDGKAVVVNKRSELSSKPATIKIGNAKAVNVTAWSSTWPTDERFWDSTKRRRAVRLQVVLEDSTAWLMSFSRNKWTTEAHWG